MKILLPLLTSVGLLAGGTAYAADIPNEPFASEPIIDDSSAILTLWVAANLFDTGDDTFDEDWTWGVGGDGRYYSEVSPEFGYQLELSGLFEENADDEGGEDTVSVQGGGHLVWRGANTDYGAFGAVNYTTFNDVDDNAVFLLGGIEAAHHMGMTTWFGNIGGLGAVGGSDNTWEWGIFGHLGARHFFTDISKVEGQIGIGTGEFDSQNSNDSDLWAQWRLEYERQFGASPLSWFIAYQGDYVSENIGNSDDTMVLHSFRLGFSANIGGGGTLYSIHRNGAGTFNLPDFHVPFSYLDDL